jgi:glycosyltransferase involved in cell wall biosynthesis
MHQSFFHTKDNRYYKEALNIYGQKGEDEFKNIKINGHPDVWKLPMSDAIVERNKRAIVHHRWVKKQLVFNNNVDVIPLFSFIETEPDDNQIKSFKSKYNISENQFIISSFGDVNLNKCPEVQIMAVKQIVDEGFPVKMIFAGKIQPETKYLFDDLKKSKYEDYIIATDYLSDIDYYSCLYASDIIINLRNPSMGEASGTLMQSFFAGKPTIIGNLNQYKEFPDEIVVGKINYGQKEAEQLNDIIKFTLENPEYRKKIGYNAKKYASEVLNLNEVMKCYLNQQ